MKRRSLLLGSAALLAGCGGGGKTNTRGSGRATFTIEWPKTTTRLIPQASNSIAIEVRQGTAVLERKVLARPATTASFDNLPEGDLVAVATAHPSSDGTGVAQAIGTTPLAIRDGETTQVPLTMASTIVGFTLAFSSLGIGETRRLMGTFRDSQNAIVLVSLNQGEYSLVGNPGAITFDAANRLVTGAASGSVQLQIRNIETGASYNASFQVVNGPTLPDIIDPAPGGLADPAHYLIWKHDISSQTVTGYDPDTAIPVLSIAVGAEDRLACLSFRGKHLFFNSLTGGRCRILDIDAGQMLPGEIKIPGRTLSVYSGLNSNLSDDQSCIINSRATGVNTEEVSIFDGFTKRPASISGEAGYLNAVSETGNFFYYLGSSSPAFYIEQCPITASGISRSSNNSAIDRILKAVTDSIVITENRKVYNSTGFGFMRELGETPFGSRFQISRIEGDFVHSLIQTPEDGGTINYKSYYARHMVSSGALMDFIELPKGGILPPINALIQFGYNRFELMRHYIHLVSVDGRGVLKKKP